MSALLQAGGARAVEAECARAEAPPRLLYLITRGERGGAQTHVLDLAAGMKAQFAVEVATGEEGFLTEACRERGIPVHVVSHLRRDIKPFSDVRALWELGRLMRRVKPHLVHAHTFKAGFLGRLAAGWLRIPSIYTVHMWPFGRAVPISWRAAGPVCERLAAKWCDRIVSVSELGARTARENGICRSCQMVPILNGIPDHPVRAHLGRARALNCTMVARFTEFKDHATLLRAFATVDRDARLTLVGDGATMPAMERLAGELGIRHKVDFMGARDDVADILAQTDVFVLASKTETLPISILEAMRAGLPVIASDVGGVSEEVVHGETGLLAKAGSVEELRRALETLLAERRLRIAMGAKGRQRFERFFLAERMIEKTAGVYREVLAERREAR